MLSRNNGSESVLLRTTTSICPRCLTRLEAYIVKKGEKVYLEKTCNSHGHFRTIIWNGLPTYESWGDVKLPSQPTGCLTQVDKGCPYDCGLCPQHRQHSCCVLLEVTQRCNLICPVCYASAGKTTSPDPSLEQVREWFDLLLNCGGPFNIQLSGGEPTLRDDLPAIIETGKAKGFSFFQLNTNGLRLAADKDYVFRLKTAGLDCVFLQFDGVTDEPYRKLRGKALLAAKLRAIENCADVGLGVVLVPTLVPGVNEDEIGVILKFALDSLPVIRGVHFQPISYFGRYGFPPERRLTIPDILLAIEEQTEGLMKINDFNPGSAENAYCSFNGKFLLLPNKEVHSLKNKTGCSCQVPKVAAESARKARYYVARHWGSSAEEACCSTATRENDQNAGSLDSFLYRLKHYTLAVSCMVFQDAWNLDLERLRDCYIHVVSSDRRIIPFCAYNLTDLSGRALHRRQVQG